MTHYERTSRPFECSSCLQECEGIPLKMTDTDICCKDCVKALFEQSVATEGNFPARWGPKILDPWDYLQAVNTFFARDYERKWKEWTCPGRERVYCRQKDPKDQRSDCGAFLGRLKAVEICGACQKCKAIVCLRCGKVVDPSSIPGTLPEASHACYTAVEARLRRLAFNGLERGKDYQDCPKCQRRIELKEACNHMTCPCGTDFCYVCGTQDPGTAHWSDGQSWPQYPQPGGNNPNHSRQGEGSLVDGQLDTIDHEIADLFAAPVRNPWVAVDGQWNEMELNSQGRQRPQELIDPDTMDVILALYGDQADLAVGLQLALEEEVEARQRQRKRRASAQRDQEARDAMRRMNLARRAEFDRLEAERAYVEQQDELARQAREAQERHERQVPVQQPINGAPSPQRDRHAAQVEFLGLPPALRRPEADQGMYDLALTLSFGQQC